jgi:L-lactate utilization protein LutB
VTKGTNTAYQKRLKAMFETDQAHGEALRQQAAAAKRRALNQLPALLEQAETNLKANGVEVLWAVDAAEACQLVLDIAQQHQVKRIAKSKSMVTEEIGLNEALEAHGIETIETDLGEYILQLNHEPPSHIVTPIIHKSKESVGQIFESKLNMPPTDDAQAMARFARQHLQLSSHPPSMRPHILPHPLAERLLHGGGGFAALQAGGDLLEIAAKIMLAGLLHGTGQGLRILRGGAGRGGCSRAV